jgi:hypothetical protein
MGARRLRDDERAMVVACFRETVRNDDRALFKPGSLVRITGKAGSSTTHEAVVVSFDRKLEKPYHVRFSRGGQLQHVRESRIVEPPPSAAPKRPAAPPPAVSPASPPTASPPTASPPTARQAVAPRPPPPHAPNRVRPIKKGSLVRVVSGKTRKAYEAVVVDVDLKLAKPIEVRYLKTGQTEHVKESAIVKPKPPPLPPPRPPPSAPRRPFPPAPLPSVPR